MKFWQRYLLRVLIGFFALHLLRDVLQDLNIDTVISSVLVKDNRANVPSWYWSVFNTYIIAIVGLILSTISLIKNRFKPEGILAITLASIFLLAWLTYWFLF